MNDNQYPQDTSVNPKVSSILGTWQNLQIILGQQVQRYIQSVNTKNQNNRRGVSISDINGLLSFLESTINNTFSVTLNQKISISKLKTQQKTMNESNNGNKQTIRLNESQVNNLVTRIVKESVRRVLCESKFKDSAKMKYGDGFIQVSVDREEGTASWYYMGNDGEPYSYGSMDIEEYVDNTWLPYEETHRPSRWIPKRIEEIVLKLFTKTGMRNEAN